MVDEAHQTLSGPATRRILEREYRQYGKPEYERLAAISASHLCTTCSNNRATANAKLAVVSIGERRRPDPQGRSGYLRVDTVHLGDQPADKARR